MPKAKTNRGRPKNISCPSCGKKFCSETNVLQHLNQPTSSCRATLWQEEITELLHQFSTFGQNSSTENAAAGTHESGGECWTPPEIPDVGNTGEFGTAGDMSGEQGTSFGRFIEVYEGCSEAFPGGKSFMDAFQEDQYAEERKQNLYFPFASREEWQFASWLLRSRLSLAAIDSLLALDIVSELFYSQYFSRCSILS